MNKNLKYSIEVYEDHAIILGWLAPEVLVLLTRLCKKEGFTHITSNQDGKGFKLVKNIKESFQEAENEKDLQSVDLAPST